jgi:hypothetical protein
MYRELTAHQPRCYGRRVEVRKDSLRKARLKEETFLEWARFSAVSSVDV